MVETNKQLEIFHAGALPRRRRAPNCSAKLTADLASKIKTMVIQLGMAQHVAAAKLNLNPGRASDVLHGRKFKDVPFAPISDVINI